MNQKLLCALGICLVAGCSKQAEDATQAMDSPAPETTPAPEMTPAPEITPAPEMTPAPEVTPAKKLLVVATFAPMYCFAKNVAGDLADVEMIVPPGVPAGGFEPSDEEVRRILQADVVIENGFGFEGWMDRLVANGLKPGAVRVIAARGTGPAIPGLPGDPDTPPGDAPLAADGPPDPHVWLDPLMAIKEVQNIRDALMARDPAHADDYMANENWYEAALRDLDDEVGRTTVVIAKRRLLCPDGTFSYFLSRYEFSAAKKGDVSYNVLLTPRDKDLSILPGNGLHPIIADPMESGRASVDFYETTTRANAEALIKGLMY